MNELFLKGGVVMWPLLGLSILGLALVLYAIFMLIKFKSYGQVSEIYLSNLQNSIDNIYLISSIAPLLGLLGTVFGIIKMFSALSTQTPDVQIISSGLSEALFTTAAGLILSIPCQIIGHFLQQGHDKCENVFKKDGLCQK